MILFSGLVSGIPHIILRNSYPEKYLHFVKIYQIET